MDGEVNWSAIPLIVGLLGVRDPEGFIVSLVAIRDGLTGANKRGEG